MPRRNKRYKAKALFYTQKYTSKQICEMVGVTQATMSKWIKKYNWRKSENVGFSRNIEALGLISPSFYNHLKANNQPLSEFIEISRYRDILYPHYSNELVQFVV